jgi:hypothetical protein
LQKITTFSAGLLTKATEPDAARALVTFVAAQAGPLLGPKGLEPA